MKRFSNILVVTAGKDGGKAAVNQAATLARQSSAKLTLVDAIESLPEGLDVSDEIANRHRSLSDKKLSDLEAIAGPLRDSGITTSYELLAGDSAEKVIHRVVLRQHDLLIKSAEQPQGLAQRLFGTMGHRLFRKCPCPVWIIKATPEPRLNRILVAVDPMPLNHDRNPMNITMMELATSLARHGDSELHIVYVWPRWTQWAGPDDRASGNEMQQPTEPHELQTQILERLIGPFRGFGVDFKTHLLKGNPGETITSLTRTLDVDLLVMGTVCRSNLSVFAIGNTAERVLDHVNCSVLAIKPESFLPSVFPDSVRDAGGFGFA